MTVALIGSSPMAGASTLTNFPMAVPTANPDGNLPAAFRYDVYSSLVSNDGRIVSVSTPSVAVVVAARSIEERCPNLVEETKGVEKAATKMHEVDDDDAHTVATATAIFLLKIIIAALCRWSNERTIR